MPTLKTYTTALGAVGQSRITGRGRRSEKSIFLRDALERAPGATVYVCGSAGFADAATDLLLALGVPTASIRTERFGPSG